MFLQFYHMALRLLLLQMILPQLVFSVQLCKVFDLIDSDETVWDREPMECLAQDGELAAYRHAGFWEAMDTVRDKEHLETLWQQGKAEWLK